MPDFWESGAVVLFVLFARAAAAIAVLWMAFALLRP
jgi:hypothetical protein